MFTCHTKPKTKNNPDIIHTLSSENVVISIAISGDAVSVETYGLKEPKPMDESDIEYNGMIDGFESMILALAAEGYDMSHEDMLKAITSALDAIGNHS